MNNSENLYYKNLINELAELHGIVSEYWNISGKKIVTSIETKKLILKSLGINIDDINEISRNIHELKWKKWKNILEPVYVISENEQPFEIPFYIPVDEELQSQLDIEFSIRNLKNNENKQFNISGTDIIVKEIQWIDGRRFIRSFLTDFERRDIGYYDLELKVFAKKNVFDGKDKIIKFSKLIITPDACYVLKNRRTWGLSINLYSIKSENNWGIGDFTDLIRLVEEASKLKCNFIGINPLHAIPNTEPFGISPYSPISRLYKNFIYLDLNTIDEFNEVKKNKDLSLFKQIQELKNKEFIDYEKIANLKLNLLRKCFLSFYEEQYLKNTERANGFKRYIDEEGIDLEKFAIFNLIYSFINKGKKIFGYEKWDDVYGKAGIELIENIKKKFKKEILFYMYIQWLIDLSLKSIYEKIEEKELIVGLYFDLAIGASKISSDVWSYKDLFVDKMSIGAPPDDFSPEGQNWGIPPLRPDKLRESGYELFIKTIRKNMKYGGALRIDHALGLFRLFWIPEGMSPKDGAYVKYPAEELIRIIALESVLNKCIVIGEDLGTIGENVRETLQKFKMLSYRLFYFERNYPDPSFLEPDKYPEMALCAITTHDLPTIYGYWIGRDIEMRKKFSKILDERYYDEQLSLRKRDKFLIVSALKKQGILPLDYPEDTEMNPILCNAIYEYLAKTPCMLLLVSIDDILGTIDQQNLPGVVAGYPNWKRKCKFTLEEIIDDRRFKDLALMLNKYFY